MSNKSNDRYNEAQYEIEQEKLTVKKKHDRPRKKA